MSKAKPRYTQVAEERQAVQKLLLNLTGMTYYEYNVMVFELGVRFVESYFYQLGEEPVVVHVKEQLLKNHQCGFWKFFTSMISEANQSYWKSVKPFYTASIDYLAREESDRRLKDGWIKELQDVLSKSLTKERLRHFIIEHETTIFNNEPQSVHQEV